MVQTAKLTEKLLVQELTVSGSSFGENIEIWKTKYVIYGSITTQKGNLRQSTDKETYTDVISFYCRYINLDKKGVRIYYNGEAYKIINLTNVQRNQATVIDVVVFK